MRNLSFSLFFKINFFLTTLLFLTFLWHYQGYTLLNFLFTILATISSAVVLYIVFYILLLPFSFHTKVILYLSSFIFIITDIILIIDFFVYKLFHFHINAMVLNIIMSPDAKDSIQTGITPVIVFILTILTLIYFELIILKKIELLHKETKHAINSKINKFITIPLLFIVLSDKVGFGLATLFSKNTLISPFKVIPLYQPLTFNKFAAKHFGFNTEEHAKYIIKTNANLNYPLQALTLDRNRSTFPIFILASDSVSYTSINPKLTPNISLLAKDALVFHHHYSGGNSTRFGIFSLMYGLNATYWFNFLNANKNPVLFDILQQRNYEINIFSSTNTNWPEFRKTCYVDIQDKIQDYFDGESWEKDEQSTTCFLNQLNVPSKKPLFSFIFLDSPHGYSYPPNANIYNAPPGEVNYIGITKDSQELIATHKRYKNAVHYNDMLIGKIIAKLKAKGLYDKSLIIFTSDHGQEFFEYGNFGHNTAFSEAQVHIPFILKLPKFLQGTHLGQKINTSLTSHQDVVPTLLTLLGVQNDPSDYSNGTNFLSDLFHRDYIFSSNWNNNAILTPQTTSVFSNLPNKMFNNEVRDTKSYLKLPHAKTKSKFILDTINENKKFLK